MYIVQRIKHILLFYEEYTSTLIYNACIHMYLQPFLYCNYFHKD